MASNKLGKKHKLYGPDVLGGFSVYIGKVLIGTVSKSKPGTLINPEPVSRGWHYYLRAVRSDFYPSRGAAIQALCAAYDQQKESAKK